VKKMLFVLFVALLMFGRAHAFERQEASLPVISEPLSRLETAVGWMKTPGGGWISRENRIPKYMSSDYDLLQDFNDYSLGVDNFQLLELREVILGGETYYLLLKHKRGGAYHYPAIREGWYYNYQVKGYVFGKTDMHPIAFEDKEPFLVEIGLIANPSKVYYNDKYENIYIQDIAVKLNEVMAKEKSDDLYLIINVMKLGGSVRFIMLEKSISISGNYEFETYAGLSATDYDLPIKIEEAVTEEVFKNFYFELDFRTFGAFWNQ